MIRALLAAVLIVAGLLACGFAVLIWLSIARSDTSTGTLVGFGLMVAVPGLGAVAAGAWLLRRGRPPA